MSGQAMMWGWMLIGCSPAAKLLGIWIGDCCCDPSGVADVSISRAAEWTGISSDDILDALEELAGFGLVYSIDHGNIIRCQVPIKPAPILSAVRKNSGHIYIVTSSADARLKIGISQRLETRLMGLQSSNPNKLAINFSLFDENIDRLKLIERIVHSRLRVFRVVGEWFTCELDTAIAEIESVNREVPTS